MITVSAKRRAMFLLVAATVCLPQAVAAQSASDHTAHHPATASAADAVPATQTAPSIADPAQQKAKPATAMAAMMDDMMGGEMITDCP